MRYKRLALALFLLPHVALTAPDTPEISNVYLDRPLWALGMEDANWLVQKKRPEKAPRFAFFSFSNQKTNMPDEPSEQREDNSGRTTRSLPLYLAERVNVETNCRAENYIFVVDNVGPVVSGKEWDIDTLSALFTSSPPDYIVTGHIIQDYLDLRSTITLRVWDIKRKRELTKLTEAQLFTEAVNVASKIPSQFVQHLKHAGLCKFSIPEHYPAPPASLLAPYLDALGQLLIQTLADNGIVRRESIWGEQDMLNWYLTLRRHMPASDAPKLMFVRGVLASVNYGGVGREQFLADLTAELETAKANDVLFKLSPFVYARVNDTKQCESRKAALKTTAKGSYLEWLNKIDCRAYNNALKGDLGDAARP